MNEKVLAVRGIGGYRQYRIPAMAVTPSGRIITIYDGRADFDDLPGPVDLLIRRSDDNGATWSTQEIFRKHEGISGFGDASIIVDPSFGKNGRVIVLYQWTRVAGFFESTLGVDLDNPSIAHIARSISDDDGTTWKHDVITDQLKDQNTPGIFATSGMGGRISTGKYAGRLLQTFVLRRKTGLLSAIGYSDDHGEHWSLGSSIKGGNETAIAGLKDGSVLVNSRATPYRIVGRSIDGGETLASLEQDFALPDPSDNGSLCVLLNGDLICTHNHDSDLRRNTVMKKSTDNGVTWSSAIVIEECSSAYSTACELSNGQIGVLYERNAYQEIVFKSFSVSEFEPTEAILKNEYFESDIEFKVVPRYIRPARNLEVEKQIKGAPQVPEVDMNNFRPFERKEVGTLGGTTSGDSLFTTEELDLILGPITPGLHENDEVRFSARITNYRDQVLTNLKLMDRDLEVIAHFDSLPQGGKTTLLDIRQRVTKNDLDIGVARFVFELSAQYADKSEFKNRVVLEMPTL